MKKTSFKIIAAFKAFVYEPAESHFFFFCDIHRNLLERKQDAVGELWGPDLEKTPICDWPTCKLKSNCEFFPNLVTVINRNRTWR